MAEIADELGLERSRTQADKETLHSSSRRSSTSSPSPDDVFDAIPLSASASASASHTHRYPPSTKDAPPGPNNGFQNLQHTQTNATTASAKAYSAFTPGQKWFIVVFSALGAIFSPISTNIYVPAIPTLAKAFNTTTERINLTVTMYLIFQALTPSLFGSAGDCFGRRPVFIVCLVVYIGSCIGSALCPTNAYWLLMIMRFVQASGGSPLISIGTGIVADIATPQERGKYLGLFNLGTMLGPSLGPLIGGVLTYGLGWRSIFWFLLIFCGCVLVPIVLALPETLRSIVGDGSIPPPPLNCTPAALMKRKREMKEMEKRGETPETLGLHRVKYEPWTSFQLFLEPDLALMFTWASLYYALWYALLTVFSSLLHNEYGANDVVVGLCYIPNGAGCGIGGFLSGKIMDVLYRREKKRVGGDHRHFPEEFRLERVRFIILPFQVGTLLASMVGLAWSMQAHAPMAVPVVLSFFVGLGTGFLPTVTIYGIDLVPGKGGSVTATFNLIRCALGAVTVSTVQLIVDRMGTGWCFVLLSGICVAGTPMVFVILHKGPGWRRKRREKAKQDEIAKRIEGL
ncbi:hypothetical protein IAT38_000808 [Cryptococcus sp. DSM 104549]